MKILRSLRVWNDWRMVIALAVLVTAFIVGAVIYDGAQEDVRKGKRVDALIAQNEVLLGRLNDARDDAQAERTAATRERDDMLRNQRIMLAQQRDLWRATARASREQRDLLEWLRDNGIQIPAELVPSVIRVPERVYVYLPPRASGGTTGRHGADKKTSRKPKAGNSGKPIPGKAKGHKNGHPGKAKGHKR